MTDYQFPTFVASCRSLHISDYPIGGQTRGLACYDIETVAKRGERFTRITQKRQGGFGKPKTTTYSDQCAILICSDGKTWLANKHTTHISIMQSNMKYSECTIWPDRDNDESEQQTLFDHVLSLIERAELSGACEIVRGDEMEQQALKNVVAAHPVIDDPEFLLVKQQVDERR